MDVSDNQNKVGWKQRQLTEKCKLNPVIGRLLFKYFPI